MAEANEEPKVTVLRPRFKTTKIQATSSEVSLMDDPTAEKSDEVPATAGSPLQKSSTQVPIDPIQYSTNLNLVAPPYNLEYLTLLNEVNTTRQACISAIATATVGRGFTIEPEEGIVVTADSPHYKIAQNIRRILNKWASRDDGKTLDELLLEVKTDEESTGGGYIEVSRTSGGKIDGLYYIPGYTMRAKRDKSGYTQLRPGYADTYSSQQTTVLLGDSSKYTQDFYKYGDKFDQQTGKLRPNRSIDINEVIPFKIFSSRSTFYGLPRDISCLNTYAGDELARNHNLKYLANGAIPEVALVFSIDPAALDKIYGDAATVEVEIDDNTKNQIEDYFRRNLSAPYYQPGLFFLPGGVQMRIERLSQQSKDASWVNYRKANKEEIRMAFHTPPVVLAEDSSAYATAQVQLKVWNDFVIQPEQQRYAARLMNCLWDDLPIEELQRGVEVDGQGVDPNHYRLKFMSITTQDKVQQAQSDSIYLQNGTVTNDEVRVRSLQLAPLSQDQKQEQMVAAAFSGKKPNADITGVGDGRSSNGEVSIKAPRRVEDTNPTAGANALTVGTPGSTIKSADTLVKSVADDEAFVKEYLGRIENAFEQALMHFAEEASMSAVERTVEGQSE